MRNMFVDNRRMGQGEVTGDMMVEGLDLEIEV
jgi:hypothetical protein